MYESDQNANLAKMNEEQARKQELKAKAAQRNAEDQRDEADAQRKEARKQTRSAKVNEVKMIRSVLWIGVRTQHNTHGSYGWVQL